MLPNVYKGGYASIVGIKDLTSYVYIYILNIVTWSESHCNITGSDTVQRTACPDKQPFRFQKRENGSNSARIFDQHSAIENSSGKIIRNSPLPDTLSNRASSPLKFPSCDPRVPKA